MSEAGELNNRINAIFERLFQASPQMLGDQVRRRELQRWDSLGHLTLLAALEKEFQIDILPEEGLAMETVGDVKSTVEKLYQRNRASR